MLVATVQFQHRPGDLEYNFSVVQRYVKEAAEHRAEIIVFPECCLTGYWHLRKLNRIQLEGLAEVVPDGFYSSQLQELSCKYGISIGVGLLERAADETLYNSYLVTNADGTHACHRKLHCFISEHLDSGDQFTVFPGPLGRQVGILICYDNNLVENVRATRLKGAEILIAPHQTGGCDSGSPYAMGVVDRALWDNRNEDPASIEEEFRGEKGRGWLMRWLPSRAHDNGLFLIFSNGVGPDDDEVRTGNAMIIDPYGRIISETNVARDQIIYGTLDFGLQSSSTGTRWLRARRPELYGKLIERSPNQESTRTVRFEHLE